MHSVACRRAEGRSPSQQSSSARSESWIGQRPIEAGVSGVSIHAGQGISSAGEVVGVRPQQPIALAGDAQCVQTKRSRGRIRQRWQQPACSRDTLCIEPSTHQQPPLSTQQERAGHQVVGRRWCSLEHADRLFGVVTRKSEIEIGFVGDPQVDRRLQDGVALGIDQRLTTYVDGGLWTIGPRGLDGDDGSSERALMARGEARDDLVENGPAPRHLPDLPEEATEGDASTVEIGHVVPGCEPPRVFEE